MASITAAICSYAGTISVDDGAGVVTLESSLARLTARAYGQATDVEGIL